MTYSKAMQLSLRRHWTIKSQTSMLSGMNSQLMLKWILIKTSNDKYYMK